MSDTFEVIRSEIVEPLGHIKVEVGLIALLHILLGQVLQVGQLLEALSVFI